MTWVGYIRCEIVIAKPLLVNGKSYIVFYRTEIQITNFE